MIQWLKTNLHKYSHAWVMLYMPIYLAWYVHLEHTVVDSFYVIHSVLDDFIPFCAYFIIPYGFWFIYMACMLTYFFFKDVNEFYRYGFYLALGMSICLFICQIFPNGTQLRPTIDPNENWATYLVSLIYKVDTSTNVFPSIHVYNSIGTHIAICKSKYFIYKPLFKHASLLSAILICTSTVFLKQHSILDVFAALILNYITYQLLYAKVSLPVTNEKEKATLV